MSESTGLDYRAAGVDLDAAERAKERLKSLVASTRDENTLSELGLFGGLYSVPGDVESPVLVSSADGVGTKLKVAFLAGRHDTVGQPSILGEIPCFIAFSTRGCRNMLGTITSRVCGSI